MDICIKNNTILYNNKVVKNENTENFKDLKLKNKNNFLNNDSLYLSNESLDKLSDKEKASDKIIIKPIEEYSFFFGNIKATQLLYNGLKSLSQDVKDIAGCIIRQDLMNSIPDDMTEDQRKAAISLGIQKEQYIADNFMTKDDGNKFMDGIKILAQIGMRGKRIDDNTVSFDTDSVFEINTPEDYVSAESLMKFTDENNYNKMKILENKGLAENNKDKLKKSQSIFLDWFINKDLNNSQNRNKYIEYKKKHDNELYSTKIDETFTNADTKNINTFLNSLKENQKASKVLNDDFFNNNINNFAALLYDI